MFSEWRKEIQVESRKNTSNTSDCNFFFVGKAKIVLFFYILLFVISYTYTEDLDFS